MSSGRRAPAPPRPDPAGLASPCVGVCRLQPGTDVCEGCWRTLAELSEWGSAGAARRREILVAAAGRRPDPKGEDATARTPRQGAPPSSS